MKLRYHMQRNGLMVEHTQRQKLEEIRRSDTRFKGAHIREVIQARPQEVKVGIIYEVTYKS